MTNIKRIYQEMKGEELLLALDQYDEYGILHLYENNPDVLGLYKRFLEEFKLKDILLKNHYANEGVKVLGKLPNKISVVENDMKFIVYPKEVEPGLPIDKSLLRSLVQEYSSNKNVLDLCAYTGHYGIYALQGKAASVNMIESDAKNIEWIKKNFEINQLDTTKIQTWHMDFNGFLDIAYETGTRYDLIILDLSTYNLERLKNFDLAVDHSALIREIQKKLLNYAGILLFVTDVKNFAMDSYIRPGADKLTKKTVPQEFLPSRPHQSFAFYN